MGSKNKKSKKSIGEEPKNEADPSNRAQNGQNGGNSRGGGKVVITDSRFASVHSDPRFAKLSKHKSKIAIDSRFDRMFTDKRFSSSSARVDKRGKPRKDSASQNALKHYYRLEEEGEKLKRKAQTADEGTESDEESEESEEELRKPGGQSSNSEPEIESDASESVEEGDEEAGEASDEDSSSDTTDTDDEDVIYSEEDNFVQEEDVPEIDKETCRLAVVNLDWRYVKAVDLYVLLSSFLPKVGQILSVAVYPSEFGLKRMEEEVLHGPVGLFDDDKEKNGSDDDDDEIDNEKLRAYELSRLRYYYAVVECDSIATADYLYKTCDGVEFERSSNKLDLRFIPDSMEFKHPPRDVATEAPANYEGLDFHTRALQNSKLHLSWDEDEPQRVKTLKRKFDDDQLAELELREFLASDDGVSDEDDNDDTMEDQSERKHKKEDLYRALLQSGEGSDEDGNEDQDQDMEITFNTGLEDLSKRLLEKKDKKSETVWEAYLRKRREKKKARKHRSKDSSEDESDDSDQEPKQDLDDFFEEPSVQGSKDGKGKRVQKGKKHQETSKEAAASRAELELLLADDREADTGLKGYNLKPKKAKGKRSKEIIDEAKIPTADFDDPRFSALFTSPMYALDPTDPQFKRSVAYARQLAQKQRKGDRELSGKKQEKILPREQAQLHSDDPETDKKELRPDRSSLKKEKHELSSMVKSVKMKSKQVQVASSSIIPANREKLRSLARK